MVSLHDMVKKILKSYLYEVVEDREGDIFVAEKEGRMVMVGVAPDVETDLLEYSERFIGQTSDFRGQRVIATLSGSPPPAVIRLAEGAGVSVWARGTLESELGRLMVQELVESDSEPIASDKPADYSLSAEPDIETKVKDWGEQIVQPKMTLEDVTELAKYTIRGFRYELELVPYYIFEFACEMVSDGHENGEKRAGLMGVNALSGEFEMWKTRFQLLPELRWAHTRLEPKIDPERSEAIARDGVVSLNTREVEKIIDKGTALIMEKKKLRPKEGAIALKRRGLVYLPVWCIEGSNGIMIVNAATGKIIKEDFYKDG